MVEQEREIHFFKSGLSAVTQVAGFTSCFSIVHTHHHATLLCQWHPLFSVQSDWYLPPLVSSTSYSVAHLPRILFSATSKSNALLKTCPYHCTLLAQASPSKVSFKLSKLVSSWLLLFSMILTPHMLLPNPF